MSTTSLKLPEELKERAATAAQELGMSTDAFMIDAIRQAAEAVEQRSQFVAEALAARADALHTGLAYDADEVKAHFRKRISDAKALVDAAFESTEQQWNEKHAAFIAAYNSLVEAEGLALQEWRAF